MPSGPASGPQGTQVKWVKVIYRARCTYSTYIFIGNQSDEKSRGRGSPPQPWGPAGRGREEESAFTQRPLLSPVCLGGLSDALSILKRGLRRSWRAGEMLKLDRDLSRPSDMRGTPGVSAGPIFRGPTRRSGLPLPCAPFGPAPRGVGTVTVLGTRL